KVGSEQVEIKFECSTEFKELLARKVEKLSRRQSRFLQKHGVEIEPVGRLPKGVMGKFIEPGEGPARIYLAEESVSEDSWNSLQNKWISHTLEHEVAQAFDCLSSGTEAWLSDAAGFCKQYDRDLLSMSKEQKEYLTKYAAGTVRNRREAFAEATAIASGKPGEPFVQSVFEECFKNVLESVRRGK
ncbi:MAG: hypothetical protein ACRD3W_22085, partial [Terriglobales bacterium]